MRALILTAIGLANCTLAVAAPTDIYTDEQLARDQRRYEQRIDELMSKGLVPVMQPAERQALAGVVIQVPLRGSHPLDAYSNGSGAAPVVVLPALTLKFVEDLSTVYAWRYVKGHSLQPVDIYMAMLKYRSPQDFPGGRLPDPLTALGVPQGITTQDERIDRMSLSLRNEAWAFILAHELAHLRWRHPGNANVDPAISQRNEQQADAFAVDLLSRADTVPMGMILWFQATVGYFKNRADFPSEEAYWNWQRRESTHPVNPSRLSSLGTQLDRAAKSASADHAELLEYIATQLVGMGDILSEPDMHRLIARCAVLASPADLRRLDDRICEVVVN